MIDLGWEALIHEIDPYDQFSQDIREMYLDSAAAQR